MQSASFELEKEYGNYFSNFVFTVCTQTDVILVKVIFGSQNADIFGGFGYCKDSSIFGSRALNLALFPLSAHLKAEGRLDNRMLYDLSIYLD